MTLQDYIFKGQRLIGTQHAVSLECIGWFVNNDSDYVDLETSVSYRQSEVDGWDFDSFNLAFTFDLDNQRAYCLFGNNLGDGLNEKFSLSYSPDKDIRTEFNEAKLACEDKKFLALMEKRSVDVDEIVSRLVALHQRLKEEISPTTYIQVTQHNKDGFNKNFPVGSEVYYQPIKAQQVFLHTKVSSMAWSLGHGEVVASVEGKSGCVSVSHLYTLM